MEVDDEILDGLKCGVCGNYLSYGPIESVGSDSVCGRCIPEDVSGVENVSYEILARLVAFPCRYRPDGCDKKFNFVEMKKHEDKCPAKVVPCPASESCEWRGNLRRLRSHYDDEHQNLIRETPCEFKPDVSRSNETNFFLFWQEFAYLVRVEADRDEILYEIDAFDDESPGDVRFILEIYNDEVNLKRRSKGADGRHVLKTNVNHLESIGEYDGLKFRLTCER